MAFTFQHWGFDPTGDPNRDPRTLVNHDMEPVRVIDGKTLLRCKNAACLWEGLYTQVEPLTAREKMDELQAQNRDLNGQIMRQLGGNQVPNQRQLELTLPMRQTFEKNEKELARLQALSPGTPVGAKFTGGMHHGGIEPFYTPDAPSSPTRAASVMEEKAPAEAPIKEYRQVARVKKPLTKKQLAAYERARQKYRNAAPESQGVPAGLTS